MNVTNVTRVPDSYDTLDTYDLVNLNSIVNVIEGVLTICVNMFIILPTVLIRPLRMDKNHIIFSTHALFDSCSGAGYAFMGVKKLQLFYPHDTVEPTTPMDCLWRWSTLFWLFGEQGTTIMMCVVAADRLFLFIKPMRYIQLLQNVGNVLVATIYVYTTPSSYEESVTNVCYLFQAIQDYRTFHASVMPIFAVISVFLYALVLAFHLKRTKTSIIELSSLQKSKIQQQNQITKIILFQCLAIVLLYAIPVGTWQASRLGFIQPLPYFVAVIIFWCTNFNAIVNSLVLIIRVKALRKGILAVFMCKPVPSQ